MKIFTQVNRSQGMIRTLVGLKSRITSTKPLLTMVIILMVGSGNAWGECTYSLSNTPSNVPVAKNGSTYWLLGTQYYYDFPTTTLCTLTNSYGISAISFSMKKDGGSNNGDFKLQCYTGSSWEDAKNSSGNNITWNVKNSNTTNVSATIDPTSNTGKASKFQIVRTSNVNFTSSSRYFTISNVKVTMATTASMPATLNVGSAAVDGNVSNTFKFKHSNRNGQTITFSSDKSAFTVSPTSVTLGCSGEETIKVTYSPTCNNKPTSAKITAKYGNTTLGTLKASASSTLNDQTVTWNTTGKATSLVAGDTLIIGGYASSSSTIGDKPAIRYTSSNTGVIRVSGDTLFAVNGMAGHSAVITAYQDADCKYAYAYATQTFQVTDKAVPTFTLYINNVAQATKTANLKVGDVVEIHCTNAPHLQLAGEDNTIFEYSVNGDKSVVTVTAKGEHANAKLTVSETGNTRIAALSEDFTFNISKHVTDISSLLDVNDFYVGNSAYAATAYDFANGTAYNTNNSEVGVQFSSTDENVINLVNGQIKALKAGPATITISQTANNKWTGASVQQTIIVKKRPAVFTWNVGSAYTWNQSISNPFTTNNHDTQITCVSDDTNVADYVDGKVVIYNVNGTAKFTLTQDGNDVWEETSKQYTVTVSKPNNHVELVYSQSLFNSTSVTSKSSNVSWSNGMLKLGADGATNWDDKYAQINFEGVPNNLKFTYYTSSGSASRSSSDWFRAPYFWVDVLVTESTGDKWYTEKWKEANKDSHETASFQLPANAKAVKIHYSGNFSGYISGLTIEERREVKPSGSADVDCGTANHGENPTEVKAILEWYNVKPLTCWITSDHPEAFELVTTSINSKLDTYKKNEEITVRGKHNVPAGTYTGILHVSNGIESTTFNLTTTTTKQTPSIKWKNELSPMSVGDVVTDAASAGSATVHYTVDGTYLTLNEQGAVVAENATDENGVDLIAYVIEDETWYAQSETIKVVVTNLQKQTITWTDKLSFKFTGTKVIDLTATSSSGVEITYELSGTGNYATLDNANKKLTVTGIGSSLYLTAKTVDNAEYYPAARTKNINSRDPNATCPSEVLYEEYNEQKLATGITSFGGEWVELTWDAEHPGAEPGLLSCKIKAGLAATGKMAIEEYVNGWRRVGEEDGYDVSLSYKTVSDVTISRNATKVRIGAPVGCTLNHYVDEIKLTQAKYCELSKSKLDFGTVTMGTAPEMSFTVHYSNLEKSLDIELENENTQFSVDKTYIGDDCGEHGTVTVTVTYNAANYVESESTNLVISNTEYTKKVSLKALVQRASQTITWDPTLSLNTTDVVAFDAVTTDAAAATGVIVKYAVTEGSDVATVTEDGQLTIIKNGTVKVKAYAEGNSQYEDATDVVKTFTISKVTPTITKNPTINAITLPATLNDVAIGLDATAKDDKNNTVTGSFAWQTETTKVLSGANDYVIVFTPNQPTGKDWYNEVVYNISVTGNKGDQSITWTRDNVTSQPCSTPTTFDASSNRGLAITYESDDESIARVDKVGNEYHLVVLTSGTVHITAKQPGNGDYNAAEDVTKTITLTREQPVITTPPTADEIFTDNHLSDAGLSGGEGKVNGVHAEGLFAWKNGDIQPEYGVHSYTATFTPSPAAWYYPAECQVSVTVNKHPHSLSWDYAGGTISVDKNDLYFGGATSSVELDNIYYTTSNAAVAEVDAEQGNKLIIHGRGTIEVIARSEGNTNYYAAEQRRTLTILPLVTTVTANPAAAEDLTYGQALNATDVVGGTVKGSDDAVLEGTWAWNNGAEQLNAGQGQVRGVTFTPNDSHWYATATSTATVNVNKANPEVTPQASAINYGQAISKSELSTASGEVAGTWSWAVDATQVLNAGVHNLTANFTSNNANYNNLSNVAVTLTVNKANPSVTPQASAITYGQPISASSLTTKTGNVDGSWSWAVDATQVLSVGNHDLKANFSSNDANYNNLSNVDVTLIVNKIETLNVDVPLSFCAGGSETFHGRTYTEAGSDVIEATGATRDTVYNVTVTILQPTVGADSKTITVGAEEAWNGINLSGYAVGSHSVVAVLTNAAGCDSTVTLTLTVNPLINEFTGNGDWNDASNWTSGVVPQESAPDVIINGDLIINSEVTVGNLTIEKDSRVVLTVTGDLTVNGISEDREEYGNMYVENGGEVAVNGSLAVGDLTVEASIGTANGSAESGQVVNAENIVYANAYIEINMDPSGILDDTKWYGFTVPFDVDAREGISRKENGVYRQCTYGTHYMLAEYDANKRLNSGKGWKYITGNTLQAGTFYYLTVDGNYNTYRFKAKNAAYTQAAPATLVMNGSTSNPNANWNAVGNSTLQHVTASFAGGEYVQVYMNGKDAYKTVHTDEATFVVGCPFFIQAKEATPLMLNEQNSSTEKYYAPHRMSENSNAVARINLSSADGGYSDQIYFSAADKEQDAYIIGQDLSKAGESKVVPQLWMAQYNQKLSVHEAVLSSNSATCPLGIYVPQTGSYTLDVERAPENSMLYLTYNGRAIWNLTYSPYVFDLTKGTTEGYGLKMYVMQVATDVETVSGERLEVSGNRKVLIDDVIYIVTPEGKMYDVTGKSANY